MQKKSVFYKLLSICLLFTMLFTGCGRRASSGSSLPEDESTAANSASGPEQNPLPELKKGLRRCTSGTDGGYYQLETVYPFSASILYIDYAARREIFLCSRPECPHNTDACTSFLPLGDEMACPTILAIDDALYFVQTGTSASAPPHLCTSSLSGTEMRTIAEFPATYTILPDFYTDGDALYFLTYDVDMDAVNNVLKIVQVDLKSGAYQELYTVSSTSFISIESAFDRNFIIDTYAANPKTGKGVWTYHFLNVDTAAFTQEIIQDGTEQCGSYWYGSTLYKIHYDEKTLESLDYRTQESRTVSYADIFSQAGFPEFDIRVGAVSINNTLVRLNCKATEEMDNPRFMFLLNLQTGNLRPFTLIKPYNRDEITIRAKTDDSYLVCTDYIISSADSSGPVPQYKYSPQYALITEEDYAASNPAYTPILSDVYPEAWA